MNRLKLLEANMNDCDLLFYWANDDKVRENSFHSDKITYENHCEWFRNKLNSDDTLIYIFKDGQDSIGVIRLEKIDKVSMLINYSIDVKCRGQGYGTKLLNLIRDTFPDTILIGKVKKENIASIKAFKKAEYLMEMEIEMEYMVFYSRKEIH